MRRTIAVLLCLGTVVLPAAPALADDCAPSGGAAVTPATPEPGDFRFNGGGWGHGAGMSQYGAQGAARLGCDADTIVETYFPGAKVETAAMPDRVRVSLDTDATQTAVTGVSGTVTWETCLDGRCTAIEPRLAAGRTWTVSPEADGSYVVRDGADEVWRGGDRFTVLRARLSQSDDDTTVVRVGNRYRWGHLEFDSLAKAVPQMYVTLDIAPFDRYLYGLAEVPSSWPEEALRAQVIAARSYAVLRRDTHEGAREACRCDVFATTVDQAYTGYEKEAEGSGGIDGQRWVDAVDATRSPDFSQARVLRHEGRTADAFYSSSHGGFSESARFVFGAEVAYLRPVDDSRWDAASDNPYRTWSKTVSAAALGEAFGVGRATSATLPEPRGSACRVGHPSRGYGGMVVRGTDGERTLTGDEVRRALGLRSTLFSVNADTQGGCETGPAAGLAGAEPPEVPAPTEPEPSAAPSPSPAPEAEPIVDRPAPAPRPSEEPPAEEPAVEPATGDVVARVAGSSRIHTAVEVSRQHWVSSPEALLTTARAYPDALAAGALAGRLGAPLLLTEPGELPSVVLEELERLRVGRVRVLGGPGAVSGGVEETLRDAGIDTVRIQGSERYTTARAVALTAGAADSREVVLALGTDYADAVAAGGLSATPGRLPVLLTDRNTLPGSTEQALAELDTARVLIMGGTGAVSTAVEKRLFTLGYEVERLAGADRFGTSAAAARAALARFGGGERPVVLATGYGFPDALAAGSLAARLGAPLQLVHDTDLDASAAAAAFLSEHASTFGSGVLVGGTAVVSDQVRDQAAEAISR